MVRPMPVGENGRIKSVSNLELVIPNKVFEFFIAKLNNHVQ